MEVTATLGPGQGGNATREFGPRAGEMRENQEGVWGLPPRSRWLGTHSYTFTVDGIRMNDPSNVMTIRDVASVWRLHHTVNRATSTA